MVSLNNTSDLTVSKLVPWTWLINNTVCRNLEFTILTVVVYICVINENYPALWSAFLVASHVLWAVWSRNLVSRSDVHLHRLVSSCLIKLPRFCQHCPVSLIRGKHGSIAGIYDNVCFWLWPKSKGNRNEWIHSGFRFFLSGDFQNSDTIFKWYEPTVLQASIIDNLNACSLDSWGLRTMLFILVQQLWALD